MTTEAPRKCTVSGTPAQDIAEPTSAETTVPPLKAAWKCGITEVPRWRSTSAPSRFIETSQMPTPRPTRNSPAATPQRGPWASTTSPTAIRPMSPTAVPSATARVAPIRSLIRPASGRPVTDPTLAANRVSPSWPAVRPSASFASAIREAHDAKTSPARAKMTKTDVRARVTRSRGIVGVGVVMAGVADNAVSSAGCRGGSEASNRFDRIDSILCLP